MRFDQALPYSIDFVIPGYERSYPRGIFKCLSFTDKDSREWFYEFVETLAAAIGRRYLPVYRMGDGEYRFAVGYKYRSRDPGQPLIDYLTHSIWRRMLRVLRWYKNRGINAGGKGYRSGSYSAAELAELKGIWIEHLQTIARQGILSLGFTYRETQFYQAYFVPMVKFFKRNGIELNATNYYPVYFVYALLNGPLRSRLYADRNVLVVTSFDDDKRKAIEQTLMEEGVASAQFICISANRSMYDKIDLASVQRPVDLVLVGAGIGSSNILCQLRPLNTLAIDAGYCIECLANPEWKRRRTFCWPDEERDGDYRPI